MSVYGVNVCVSVHEHVCVCVSVIKMNGRRKGDYL